MRYLKVVDEEEARAPGGELDNWVTPRWAIDAVLPHIAWRRAGAWALIDPGAGCGDVSLAAAESGAIIVKNFLAIELHPGRATLCEEAFNRRIAAPHSVSRADWTSPAVADRLLAWFAANRTGANVLVLGNPPYTKPRETIGLEFVEQALRVAGRGVVAMLLPLDFATGVDRAERIHDRHRCSCYPLRRRPKFGGPSTGQRPVAWFVWDGVARERSDFRVL